MTKSLDITKLIQQKLKDATSLSKKHSFFSSFFNTTDYYRAAQIYTEIGELYLSLNQNKEAEKYFTKSAELYTLSGEIGESLYAYKKAGDVSNNIEMWKRASECAWAIGNNSIGASLELKMGEISGREEHYRNAIKFYKRDGMKISAKNVMDKLVWILIKNNKCEEAGHMFLEINTDVKEFKSNLNILCAYLCFFIAGEEELMDNVKFIADEEELEVIEKLEEEQEEGLDKYLEKRVVKADVRILFQKVKDKIHSEEDIL